MSILVRPERIISNLNEMNAIIELKDIKRDFRVGSETVHALRGVSFTIQAGEFVTIMGTSGSGKSTLLNLLGCLDTPTSGEYWLDGLHCVIIKSVLFFSLIICCLRLLLLKM